MIEYGPRVIARKNLPARIPVFSTVVLWLLLDRLGVRGVWVGVIWTLWGVWVLIAVFVFFMQHETDILGGSK